MMFFYLHFYCLSCIAAENRRDHLQLPFLAQSVDHLRWQVFACFNQGFPREVTVLADPKQLQMMKQEMRTR